MMRESAKRDAMSRRHASSTEQQGARRGAHTPHIPSPFRRDMLYSAIYHIPCPGTTGFPRLATISRHGIHSDPHLPFSRDDRYAKESLRKTANSFQTSLELLIASCHCGRVSSTIWMNVTENSPVLEFFRQMST